jgi:alpha-amylase/alpha-mannosidase (GH57 family)
MSIKTTVDLTKTQIQRKPTIEEIKYMNRRLDEAGLKPTRQETETALEEHNRRCIKLLYDRSILKSDIFKEIIEMDKKEFVNKEDKINAEETNSILAEQANTAMTNLIEYLESDQGQIIVRAFNGGLDNGEISCLNEDEMRIILRLRVLMEALDF